MAMPRPIPRPEPVTTATLPSSMPIILLPSPSRSVEGVSDSRMTGYPTPRGRRRRYAVSTSEARRLRLRSGPRRSRVHASLQPAEDVFGKPGVGRFAVPTAGLHVVVVSPVVVDS